MKKIIIMNLERMVSFLFPVVMREKVLKAHILNLEKMCHLKLVVSPGVEPMMANNLPLVKMALPVIPDFTKRRSNGSLC